MILTVKFSIDKNAYGQVTVEEQNDGTYGVIYFCTRNYIIFDIIIVN